MLPLIVFCSGWFELSCMMTGWWKSSGFVRVHFVESLSLWGLISGVIPAIVRREMLRVNVQLRYCMISESCNVFYFVLRWRKVLLCTRLHGNGACPVNWIALVPLYNWLRWSRCGLDVCGTIRRSWIELDLMCIHWGLERCDPLCFDWAPIWIVSLLSGAGNKGNWIPEGYGFIRC